MKVKPFLHKNMMFIVTLGVAVTILYMTMAFSHYRVATGSMEPTLPVGTVVFTTTPGVLHPTDIISFHNPDTGSITTHTFIGYDKNGNVMTKGDANPTPDVFDRPLTKADVVGKVLFKVVPFWSSLRGIGIMMLLVSGLVVIWLARRIKDVVPVDQPREEVRATNPV